MTLGPLQILPPKPRMTLDAFRELSSKASSQKREMSQVIDAFQNAAARLGFGSTNLMEGTSYPFNRITLNYVLLTSLYRGNWIIRKIVDAIADDMTKNWLSLDTELAPDKIKRFDKEGIEETATVARLNKAIKLGRLYGGAVAVMVIKGDDNFEKPLIVDDIELGSYKGLLVFDRWSGVSPSLNIITDIDDPIGFGLPEYYQITTETAKFFKVHHSRVLRFCGPDLPNWEWQANMRWGASVVEAMFEELKKRDNTSWNIASLVFRANIMEMPHKTLSAMLSGLGANQQTAQQFYNTLSAITHLMSNQGLLITPEDSGGVRTHQYSFGGINDVYQSFMLDICGATEYPMSRLFGRTVSGLGQSNEGDEHSYYELVGQRQKTEMQPQMLKLMPVVAMSVFGKIPKDFSWKYNPVRALTNEEEADLSQKKSQPVVETFNAGIISQQTALKELKQQSDETGLFSNITDEDIENANDEAMGGEMGMSGEGGMPEENGSEEEEPQSATEMLLGKEDDDEDGEKKPPQRKKTKDAWEERQHPRAGVGQKRGNSKGGQFVAGAGGGGSVPKKGSGVHGSHQTKLKFGADREERRGKQAQGIKGKHPEMNTSVARHHLSRVEQMLKRQHPDWSTEQLAEFLDKRYLPHIKEKVEAAAEHKEQNGGKDMGAGTMAKLLNRPENRAKAISAYGHDRKMGSIASTLGMPRNKAARGQLRKLLRKAGVYKEAGGWEASGKVDVGFAANLVGKIELLEKHLSTDKITGSKNLGGGVNVTRVITFADGSKGIFKPHSGEAAGMRRGYISEGYMTEREVAAWEIAKIVGMDDMGTPCVDRIYDGQRGAVQQFNQGAKIAAREYGERRFDGQDDRRRMAIYDFVIGNTDRHSGNWMINSEGKIKLIDHGLAFPEKNGISRNAALGEVRRNNPMESPEKWAKPFIEKTEDLLKYMKKSGIPQNAAIAMGERLTKLRKAKTWKDLTVREY